MVLKVVADFNNFTDIADKLLKFNYMFSHNALYISDVHGLNEKRFKKLVGDIFQSNYFLTVIDENNVAREPKACKDWCEKQLLWVKMIKVEKEHQKELQEMIRRIDLLENIILQEGSDGANGRSEDGRTKEETRETSEEEAPN